MNLRSLSLLAAALFLLLAAVFQNASQLYFMAAVIISVALVARLAVWASLRGLVVRRRVVDRVFEEEQITVFLTVSNPSRFPRFFLSLEESLSPWLEADQAKFLLPVLWPGETARLDYRCRATKRGRLGVGPMQLNATDPIGIYLRESAFPEVSTAVVYPRPIEIASYSTEGNVHFGGGMAERRARPGAGLDFHGVRDYKPGDELRRIHWKVVARHQRLAVIEFQEAYTADITIALDLREGSNVGEGKETTLEYGVKLAASLARRAFDDGARVALALNDGTGLQVAVCSREDEFYRVLELLAGAEATGPAMISSLVSQLRPHISPGSALVVITSEPDAELPGLARFLDGESISLDAVLIDASSFSTDRDPTAAGGRVSSGSEPEATSLQRAWKWLWSTEEEQQAANRPRRARRGHPKPPPRWLQRLQDWVLLGAGDGAEQGDGGAHARAGPRVILPRPSSDHQAEHYLALAESLRQLRATTHIVSRGDDLVSSIRHIIGGE